MIYLLFSLFTAVLSLPYYHRMRTFDFNPWLSYALSLLLSSILAASLTYLIYCAQIGRSTDITLLLPDLVSTWVFWILAVGIWIAHSILILTSKHLKESVGDGDGFLFIIYIVLSAGIAFSVAFGFMSLIV